MLPSGADVLFTLGGDAIATFDDAEVVVEIAGKPGSRKTLIGGASGSYLPTGHLMFGHNGRILAAPFDVAQRRLTGAAVPVLNGVAMSATTGALNAVASDTGTLAYVPGSMLDVGPDSLVEIDRNGLVTPLGASYPYFLDELSVSPDGGRVAVRVAKANDDIHVYESSGTFGRLTLDNGDEMNPVWTPDGRRVVYSSTKTGNLNLYSRLADGSGPVEQLLESANDLRAFSISPDGRFLAYTHRHPATGHDIWVLPLTGDRTPHAVLDSSFQENLPVFSPDGQWLAYDSDESGRRQVYVMRFPDRRDRRQVSVDGGTEPLWSANGRELYFINGRDFMAASPGSESSAAAPRTLFQYPFSTSLVGRKYGVMSNGRFVTVAHGSTDSLSEIRLIVNWFEELKRRVPTK